MEKHEKLLIIIHWFVGIGALFGGGAAILEPEGPLGIPIDTLKNGPFTSFLIPGLILFFLLGLGNILCALSFKYKNKYQGYFSSMVSWALVIWIVVQCYILMAINPLHVIYLIIGLLQAGLSMKLLWDKNQFPTNIAQILFKK